MAESEYDRFLSDRAYAKARLDELYEDFPEGFPETFPWGYALYGFTDPSIKREIRCRRIRLDHGQTVFAIAPAFVMPYMTGGERLHPGGIGCSVSLADRLREGL